MTSYQGARKEMEKDELVTVIGQEMVERRNRVLIFCDLCGFIAHIVPACISSTYVLCQSAQQTAVVSHGGSH